MFNKILACYRSEPIPWRDDHGGRFSQGVVYNFLALLPGKRYLFFPSSHPDTDPLDYMKQYSEAQLKSDTSKAFGTYKWDDDKKILRLSFRVLGKDTEHVFTIESYRKLRKVDGGTTYELISV